MITKVYICIHQGFGDLFNSIGIINYYSNLFDKIYVFLLDIIETGGDNIVIYIKGGPVRVKGIYNGRFARR